MSSEPRDQYLAVCDELQRVVAERDALRARVAELEVDRNNIQWAMAAQVDEYKADLAAARALLKRQPPSDCRPCHECGAIWWSDEHGCWFVGGQRERTALAGKDAP